MKQHWHIQNPDPKAVRKLSASLKCHPLTAAVLINRNIHTPEDANRFLEASLHDLRPPFDIKDMDVAVSRICQAIARRENILIFGDYDADGVTATAMLVEFFRQAGIEVLRYIPHRTEEGYSIQTDHVTNIAIPENVSLVITADCGSSSHDALASAKEAGIDVIVTDHHDVPENLPRALAVVNPKRSDCFSGLDDLSGIGVAFYLIIALRSELRDMGYWTDHSEPNLKRFCDLVAIGTIADMVPLLNENRILVKAGFQEISAGIRPGLKALLESSGMQKYPIESQDIAFKLAPRLNAAGRMHHARIALDLLLADTPATARDLSQTLNQLNADRQEMENDLLEQAMQKIQSIPNQLQKKSLVLCSDVWAEGILGIVASKLVNRFYCPTVLISIHNGVGKASARSIPGFDLHRGLVACSHQLIAFGGHAMAAGFTIAEDRIADFETSFESVIEKMTTSDDFIPKINIDYELALEDINDGIIDELESLQPFGTDNPEPLLMAKNIRILSSNIVGGRHRRMRIGSDAGRKVFNSIQFGIDPDTSISTHYDAVLFRLKWNYWNGKKTAQIVVEDFCPDSS